MKKLLVILLLFFPVHGAWAELTKDEAFKKLSKTPHRIEGVWRFPQGEILILRSKNYQKNYQYDIYNINIHPGRWVSGAIVGNLIRTAKTGVFLGEMKNGYEYYDTRLNVSNRKTYKETIWYQAETQFNLNSFHKISYVFKKHDTGERTTQDNVKIIANEITGTITKIYPLEKPVKKKKKPVYDEETRKMVDEIFGKKEVEKTWWQKQKDKREGKKDAEVTCAHFAGRKANTDKMAKIIYNYCMEQKGY